MNKEISSTFIQRMISPKRGLSREEAASYIGVSPTKFDELVKEGSMPQPKRINRRKIWDIFALDHHFDDLPEHSAINQWDRVLYGD